MRNAPVDPYDGTMQSTHDLSLFAFLMAAHRLPVRIAMLLGDATYLRRQLRLACTTDDSALQQLALGMLRQTDRAPAPASATARH